MTALITFLHVVTAVFLVIVILMQSGRGGGLTESFASAESMFGARTNEFMVRATAVLAGLFLVTNLSLAYLNAKKERSLMEGVMPVKTLSIPVPADEPAVNTAPPEAEPAS